MRSSSSGWLVAATLGSALVVAGIAGAAPLPSAGGVDADYLVDGDVLDADAWIADLVEIALAGVDHSIAPDESQSFGITEAWQRAFPSLFDEGGTGTITGYGNEPEPNGISGWVVFTIDDKDLESVDNPFALAFAVRDAEGNCAAAAVYGYPEIDQGRRVDIGDDCTGGAVMDVLWEQQRAAGPGEWEPVAVAAVEGSHRRALGQLRAAHRSFWATVAPALDSIAEATHAQEAQDAGAVVHEALVALDGELRALALDDELGRQRDEALAALAEPLALFAEQNGRTDGADYSGPTAALAAFSVPYEALLVGAGIDWDSPLTSQFEIDADYVVGAEVLDAATWRDHLVWVAMENVDFGIPTSASRSYGIVESWRAGYPSVLASWQLVAPGSGAPNNGISGPGVFLVDPAQEPSAANPYVVAFAVRDTGGVCAAAVVYGHPDVDSWERIDLPGHCSAAAVMDVLSAPG